MSFWSKRRIRITVAVFSLLFMFITSLFLTQAVTERNYANENSRLLSFRCGINAYNKDNYSIIYVQFSVIESIAIDVADVVAYIELYHGDYYGSSSYDLIIPIPMKQSEIEDYIGIYSTKEDNRIIYHAFINYTSFDNKQLSEPDRTYGKIEYRIQTTYIGIFWTRISISKLENRGFRPHITIP